jgi:tight adherence protein C
MKLLVAFMIGSCVTGLAMELLERTPRPRRLSADAVTQWLHAKVATLAARLRWPIFQKYRDQLKGLLDEISPRLPVDADLLLTLQIVCAIAAGLVFILVGPVVSLFAAAGFSLLPYFYFKTQRKKLHEALLRALPDALDLIAIVMEAGIDFSSAIDCFVQKGAPTPLRDLFAGYQKEIQMGLARAEALNRLGQRTTFRPLRDVLKSISHALALGGSLAPFLYEQAAMLRAQRMQAAEKKAAEAPLKVLFPLFAFIFPTVFIVLFGPVLLLFLKGGF